MPSKRVTISLFLLVSLFISAAAFAQSGNQASLEGTVVDSSGAVVPNASIQLTNQGTGAVLTTTTDPSGYFRFPVIPVGMYDLAVNQSGFAPYSARSIDVAVGAKVNLKVPLAIAGKAEAVNVTAELPV